MTSLLEMIDARIAHFNDSLIKGEDDTLRTVMILEELRQVRQKVVEIAKEFQSRKQHADDYPGYHPIEDGVSRAYKAALEFIGQPKQA